MKAQPGPMVSGSHFFPKAPLLWVKWMPAWAVMSRKVTCARPSVTSSKGNTHHRDTEAQRKALLAFSSWLLAKGQKPKAKSGFSLCLCDSVADLALSRLITFGLRESQ